MDLLSEISLFIASSASFLLFRSSNILVSILLSNPHSKTSCTLLISLIQDITQLILVFIHIFWINRILFLILSICFSAHKIFFLTFIILLSIIGFNDCIEKLIEDNQLSHNILAYLEENCQFVVSLVSSQILLHPTTKFGIFLFKVGSHQVKCTSVIFNCSFNDFKASSNILSHCKEEASISHSLWQNLQVQLQSSIIFSLILFRSRIFE